MPPAPSAETPKPKPVNPPPPPVQTWTILGADEKRSRSDVSAERMHMTPHGGLAFMTGNEIVYAVNGGHWFSVELHTPKT